LDEKFHTFLSSENKFAAFKKTHGKKYFMIEHVFTTFQPFSGPQLDLQLVLGFSGRHGRPAGTNTGVEYKSPSAPPDLGEHTCMYPASAVALVVTRPNRGFPELRGLRGANFTPGWCQTAALWRRVCGSIFRRIFSNFFKF
jgi:hypothetical protein